MFAVPSAGLPAHVPGSVARPRLPRRHPGMVLSRLRALEDGRAYEDRAWACWFTDRGQSYRPHPH